MLMCINNRTNSGLPQAALKYVDIVDLYLGMTNYPRTLEYLLPQKNRSKHFITLKQKLRLTKGIKFSHYHRTE